MCVQLSLLAELGFGGALLYIDPCDTPPGRHTWHQAFRITLNPGGNPTMGECLVTRVFLCNILFYLSVQVSGSDTALMMLHDLGQNCPINRDSVSVYRMESSTHTSFYPSF